MAASVTDYTSVATVGTYMPDVNTASNTSILTSLIHAASRHIDTVTGQFFYSEQAITKFIHLIDANGNMQGGRQITSPQPFFPTKIGTIGAVGVGATSLTYTVVSGPAPVQGDTLALIDGMNSEDLTINGAVTGAGPYTCPVPATAYAHAASTSAWLQLTIVMAYYENQPRNQWLTLNGDGITPPSNFYLWPPNPRTYSSAGASYYKPWWGIDLAHVPSPNTQFLPIAIGGYKTIGITASWGWPAVPDLVTDLCSKMVVRAWKARESGQAATGGASEFGAVNMSHHFDEKDLEVLYASDLVAVAI